MWPFLQTACLWSEKGSAAWHRLQRSKNVCLFIFFLTWPIRTCDGWHTHTHTQSHRLCPLIICSFEDGHFWSPFEVTFTNVVRLRASINWLPHSKFKDLCLFIYNEFIYEPEPAGQEQLHQYVFNPPSKHRCRAAVTPASKTAFELIW